MKTKTEHAKDLTALADLAGLVAELAEDIVSDGIPRRACARSFCADLTTVAGRAGDLSDLALVEALDAEAGDAEALTARVIDLSGISRRAGDLAGRAGDLAEDLADFTAAHAVAAIAHAVAADLITFAGDLAALANRAKVKAETP